MHTPLLPVPPKSLLSRRVSTFFSRNPISTSVMSFEERIYTVVSFTDADDQYIKSQIEAVAPNLNAFTLF